MGLWTKKIIKKDNPELKLHLHLLHVPYAPFTEDDFGTGSKPLDWTTKCPHHEDIINGTDVYLRLAMSMENHNAMKS